MNIGITLLTPIIACGGCFDRNLNMTFPFIQYWFILVHVWMLVVGPICWGVVRFKGEKKFIKPLWLIPVAIMCTLVTMPFTMGAAMFPSVLIILVWVLMILKTFSQPNLLWKKINRILLFVIIACIPVSYILPHGSGCLDKYQQKHKANKANEPTSVNASDPVDTQSEAALF